MINGKTPANATGWRTRPLCRSYLLVRLEALRVQVAKEGVECDLLAHFASGVHANGEFEVLGFWLESDAHVAREHDICIDLRFRGVEKIQILVSKGSEGCEGSAITVFPRALLLWDGGQLLHKRPAPPEMPLAAEAQPGTFDDPGLLSALVPGLRKAMASGEDSAETLKRSSRRAIERHGIFPSEEEATSFVVGVLQRAERRLAARSTVEGACKHRAGSRKSASGRSRVEALGL